MLKVSFLLMAWTVRGMFSPFFFPLEVFTEHYQLHFMLLYLVFQLYTLFQVSKVSSKIFSKKTYRLLLHDRGDGFQNMGIVHLYVFGLPLQGHFASWCKDQLWSNRNNMGLKLIQGWLCVSGCVDMISAFIVMIAVRAARWQIGYGTLPRSLIVQTIQITVGMQQEHHHQVSEYK